ncbi:MAG: ornithine cyclodeaminase [Rhodobacteraceae bacterium]|nr:ornithine cyclodeaminase [Paracoccaceae bacterium]
MVEHVTFDGADRLLDWLELTDAIENGHAFARAKIGDQLLWQRDATLLSRAAWVDGLGSAVKTAFVVPSNTARNLPTTNGAVTLFDDQTGELTALMDFGLVTKWKTAGDSLLAARKLARPDSSRILIIGAGTVARSMVEAYSAGFPQAEFEVWNRTPGNTEALIADYRDRAVINIAADLQKAVRNADIVTCATMAVEPILRGEWLSAGTHLDLIGAYRPDMREADDEALRRSRIFVDSRDTTLDHIGELKIPLQNGVIEPADIIADFYDLGTGSFRRTDADSITLFKNGGGAHLDLMTAIHILGKWKAC